jgi:hypothetical protein
MVQPTASRAITSSTHNLELEAGTHLWWWVHMCDLAQHAGPGPVVPRVAAVMRVRQLQQYKPGSTHKGVCQLPSWSGCCGNQSPCSMRGKM